MITVTLYSRTDCHLCDQAKEELAALKDRYPHRLLVLDVDENEDLRREMEDKVPVVEVGPYRLNAPFEPQELEVTLSAAVDRANQLESLGDRSYEMRKARGKVVSRTDRFTFWLANRYMLVFNLLVFLYVGIPFLAPVLVQNGMQQPAAMIYRVYGAVCHQLAFRSWFLFGEQSIYPRSAAEIADVKTFGEATGIDEGDLTAARNFTGDDQLGYKVAFCERDVAIYGGILTFGLIFALSGRRLPALPWYLWVLVGVIPIAADGFSQLLSQPPFSLWAYRESTPLLRVLTGGLFGISTAWFGYPHLERTMEDTRRLLTLKLARNKMDSEQDTLD